MSTLSRTEWRAVGTICAAAVTAGPHEEREASWALAAARDEVAGKGVEGRDDQASTATIASIAQTESTTTQTRCMISHLPRSTSAQRARALAVPLPEESLPERAGVRARRWRRRR